MGNPSMYDVDLYRQARMPTDNKKILSQLANCGLSFDKIKSVIKTMDRQDAITRYKWYNLPDGITSEMIERVLYYKGQGMLFNLADRFYFLPFTLASADSNGGIDCYGRYKDAKPVVMGSTTSNDKNTLFNDKVYKVIYRVKDIEGKNPNECCVTLRDYTPGISYNLSVADCREQLNDVIVSMQAELIPFMRTALIRKTGVCAIRTNNSGEATQIEELNDEIQECATLGKPFMATTGQMDFQDISGAANTSDASEFMSAYQSLDNLRKRALGIATDGLLQKNQHVLTGEQEMNESSGEGQMDDGLFQRQMFCIMCEAVWHLGIWCEANITKDNGASDSKEQEEQEGEEENENV